VSIINALLTGLSPTIPAIRRSTTFRVALAILDISGLLLVFASSALAGGGNWSG
jgi:hypothetical protein